MEHRDWAVSSGSTHFACNYQLISDNLLDLTHEAFVHRDSLGNEAIVENPIAVQCTERSVRVARLMPDSLPPPFYQSHLTAVAGNEGRVDRWPEIVFQPPAHLVLDVGVTPTGNPRAAGLECFDMNSITPETEHSSFMFWGFARKFAVQHEDLTVRITRSVAKIINEDKAACEAAYQVMLRSRGLETIDINADRGNVVARRLVSALITKERERGHQVAQ